MSDHVDMDRSTRPAEPRGSATSRTHVVATASHPLKAVGGYLLEGCRASVLVRARGLSSEPRDGLGDGGDRG
jgi:hypothetical protein